MKKVMFLMAVAGMFAFAACNNTPAEEEVIDTTATTEVVEEQVADTNAPVEEAAQEAEQVAEVK